MGKGGSFPELEIQVLKEKKGRMPDNQNPHTSVLEEKGNVWGTGRGSRTAAWHGRCRGVAFPL